MTEDEFLHGEMFMLGANEFAEPDATDKFPRDRYFLPEHLLLDLWFDWKRRSVRGTVTHTLKAINDGLQNIVLDAVDMKIRAVRCEGKRLAFDYDGRSVTIHLSRKLKEGGKVTLAIRYEARPRNGLFFMIPDEKYPKKPYQIWSQGEMEDNRFWFPSYDYPNARVTSEAVLHIERRYTALSNGALISVKDDKRTGTRAFHWRQAIPHVNYLINVAIGEFDSKEEMCDGVPLQYYVPKGEGKFIPLSFKCTPSVMKFFNKVTGLKFPYEKYAQVVVHDFTFGGMENTTLTTLFHATVHDEDSLPDLRIDSLISHEMAHQWFGDLLTTKSWAHLWLNEGFATYFQPLWYEHEYGKEEFQYAMRQHAAIYFSEAAERYSRPIVTTRFNEPEDMFDGHSYQKGACVLHMMRYVLGDDQFFKSIRHYVKKHIQGVVETTDLKEAVEEATGRDLEWFFKQWVYCAGHPAFDVSWSWDDATSCVVLGVKQTQKVDNHSPMFRTPVDIVLVSDDAKIERRRIEITAKDYTFYLASRKRPKCVLFDPDGWVLKGLRFKKEKEELLFQVKKAPFIIARIQACEELGKIAHDVEVADELGKVLKADRFYGVRANAARALGDIGTPDAKRNLILGLKDKDSRVRRAVTESLGSFRDEDVVSILAEAFKGERKHYAAASIILGLGMTRLPSAYDKILLGLKRDSHNSVVAANVFNALVELRDERGIELAKKYTVCGQPNAVRQSAILCLGKLGELFDKRSEEVREFLIPILKDPSHIARSATIFALDALGDIGAIRYLYPAMEGEALGLIRRVARRAIRHIREKDGEKRAQKADVAKELEEVKKENKELKTRIEKIEERIKALGEKRAGKRRKR